MRKVVLITGSSSGIGDAIARFLLQQNYKVYASARNIDNLDSLKKLGASVLTLDVTHEESIKNVINEVKRNEGKLDVLINNVGYGQFGVFEYINDEQARRQMDVNVFGLASAIRSALPLLRQSNDARIINISSIAGKVSLPFGVVFCIQICGRCHY